MPEATLIVATSQRAEDDAIEALCRQNGVEVFRGDAEDVLSRYVAVTERYSLNPIVRICGDCPLIDPDIVTATMHAFAAGEFDYYSNVRPRSFPRGLDCEVFTAELVHRAFRERRQDDTGEHVVGPYVRRNDPPLRQGNYLGVQDLSGLRWTLDEPADLELLRRIYQDLYPANPRFGYRDVLDLLARKPDLNTINAHVSQKPV